MKTNKSSNLTKKITLIIFGVVVISGGVVGAYYITRHNNTPTLTSQNTENEKPRDLNDIDYSGPSEADISGSQNAKKNNKSSSNNDSANITNNTSLKRVGVAISYAEFNDGKLEVRSFIPDVIEGSGTCTVTATKGDIVIKRDSQAFIDASSSQCTPIYIDQSEFSEKGKWRIVVTYKSSSSEGTSESEEISL